MPGKSGKPKSEASRKKGKQVGGMKSPGLVESRGGHQGGKPSLYVALVGSAGALESFEGFLRNTPADTDIAFFVVQHLSPTQKSLLPEILRRATDMPVVEIKEGMRAEPGRVHINPPGRTVSMEQGRLHLLGPDAAPSKHMPIDHFLRQLAEDQGERAACVILSGFGTDGTLGLKAVKAYGGLALVQDPGTAQFDPMPRSAVDTGLADHVGPVAELPARLMELKAGEPRPAKEPTAVRHVSDDGLRLIFSLLHKHTGHDFSQYKPSTLMRRLDRRLSAQRIDSIEHYARYLRENPSEIDHLFREFLIGVTSFFRDAEAFEALQRQVVPKILLGKKKGEEVRVWVPGCSTGEEVYSIAILLREGLDDLPRGHGLKVTIFATDIDTDSIEKARQGQYPEGISADVSQQRLSRFFIQNDQGYRIRQDIREMVVFAPQNILRDPPFTKLDLLCCRNLLIYLTGELQKRLLPLFHYALKPQGFLFLGSAETVGGFGDLFTSLDNKWKIYQRRDGATERDLASLSFPSFQAEPLDREGRVKQGAVPKGTLAESAQQVLVASFTPPAVFINAKGDILYVNGRTGKYLEPSMGRASMNVYDMAREGLRYELGSAVRKARAEGADIAVRSVKVKTNGDYQMINLHVRPISEPESLRGLLLVVFEDAPQRKRVRDKRLAGEDLDRYNDAVKECEEELKRTRERLQTTVEEMETSQEELKSANEELQSMNEELQSTNEELTTSKEEMQSLNEELVTVNSELQNKVDELSESMGDMNNLLNSTEIATLFLDRDLHVKRFTSQAARIVNLIPTDIGRPLAHLATSLRYDRLSENAREVLETLIFQEHQVRAQDGRWLLLRIHPYRTVDNVIDGVVITFLDISALKRLEEALQEARAFTQSIVDTVRQPLLVLDGQLRVVSASKAFHETFRVNQAETKGRMLYDLGNGQWDIPALRKLLEEILPDKTAFEDFVVEHTFPSIGHKVYSLNARRILRDGQETQSILLAMEDVTDRPDRRKAPQGTA